MRLVALFFIFITPLSHSFEFDRVCGDFTTPAKNTSAALMLSGGSGGNKPGEKEATREWLTLSGGGDFLVIRSNGVGSQAKWACRTFPEFVKSAAEISIDSIEDANHPAVNQLIKEAEVIWIAGGDQNRYEDFWKGTKLSQSLNEHVQSKAIGGTSAGMAILGSSYYAPRYKKAVIGSELLNDPYHKESQDLFHDDLIQHPLLENTFNETHVDRVIEGETRHSRLAGFLARAQAENPKEKMRAIGLNEASYIVTDEFGVGKVYGQKAYFVQANDRPKTLKAKQPISDFKMQVYVIEANPNGYGEISLMTWQGFTGGQSQSWKIERGELVY
ncbi:type 1 glutamine amidotransferase-like domain-containing protein [Bermanella marisrubri]|uniref:Cyanophycinase and related exopeptidase-like protein n=1 Tax=Bermanella marisrubri TaxID=207949 RepID=Q1MXV8_9GAMM|nr:Type 1 glutamine amidotransferase-like domain-containing protein [Bermanella marisrubri]EAT10820.1 Cyanophycinase and related exopeptidase-like protein [Oceanobacter sp. RED65] [Bermanella marisrubri]QIZ85676.1 type 1 glutamine amidotransferase-like domain-containing protein [Bermanella marisrubri]